MKNRTSTSIAVGSALALTTALTATAVEANPFGFSELKQGYEISRIAEGNCGGEKKKSETEKKEKAEEAKCGEGKSAAAR